LTKLHRQHSVISKGNLDRSCEFSSLTNRKLLGLKVSNVSYKATILILDQLKFHQN